MLLDFPLAIEMRDAANSVDAAGRGVDEVLDACPRRRVDQRDAARGLLLAALLYSEDSVYAFQRGYQY